MTKENYRIAYEKMAGSLISDIATSEMVVIFTSNLTDIRMIERHLINHDLPFKVIEMGMGNIHNRNGFRELCETTGWKMLPQIYVNGEFIGGTDEFFRHPEVVSSHYLVDRNLDNITLQ